MDGQLRNMTALYLLKGDRVLLLYRQGGKVVNNVWTGSAGGHFEKDELNDARACVIRELKEELGLQADDIEGLQLRYIGLRKTNGEVRLNYYFFAELKDTVDENLVSNEGKCQWFHLDDTAPLEMPLTAMYVMEHYRQVGRFTDALYVGAACPDDMEFHELMES